jgi:hypothetical protein
MTMKPITVTEKKALIQMHGERMERAFQGLCETRRGELIEHAQRFIELVKSLPKDEFSPEERA